LYAYALQLDLDGVVIDPATLPGGSAGPYDRGITIVHGVRHWMSLFHTFESHGNEAETASCYGQRDYIFDTRAEGSAAYLCQVVGG
jgi:hypothetical protein